MVEFGDMIFFQHHFLFGVGKFWVLKQGLVIANNFYTTLNIFGVLKLATSTSNTCIFMLMYCINYLFLMALDSFLQLFSLTPLSLCLSLNPNMCAVSSLQVNPHIWMTTDLLLQE